MIRLAFAALAAFALVTAPAGAFGFEYYYAKSGYPLRWHENTLSLTLSTVEADEVSALELANAVEASFNAWEGAGCGVPTVSVGGSSNATRRTVPSSVCEIPDNVIVFVKSRDQWLASGYLENYIAVTSISHDEATGQIVDADIEINDARFRFSVSDDVQAPWVDLQSMLTHEAGHFFGLDHSDLNDATMFELYASRDNAIGPRSLAQDDVDGICALYDEPLIDSGRSCEGGASGCESAPETPWAPWTAALALLGLVTLRWRRARG